MATQMIQISGLDAGITEDFIKTIFGQYGPVSSCKLTPPAAAGQTASCQLGISNEAATKWILENLNGNIPQGMQAPVYISAVAAGQEGQAASPPPAPPAPAAPPVAQAPAAGGKGEGKSVNNNLYVTGLPPGCTDEQMSHIFGQYGTVVSTKLLPQIPGKPGSAGFVRFSTDEQAKYIVENLNGNIPMGMQTPIQVKFAEQAGNSEGDWSCPACGHMNFKRRDTCHRCGASQSGDAGGGAAKGGGKDDGGMDLYVTGLPLQSTDEDIKRLFIPYGAVHRIKLLPVAPGRPSCAGFIRMDADKGKWCVENLNGVQPDGFPQALQVSVAASQNKGDKGKGKGFDGAKGAAPPPPPPAPAGGEYASTLMPLPGNNQKIVNLYITGIPHDWNEERLQALFANYGDVVSCKVLPVNSQKNACAGFLRMAEPEAMWCVREMTGYPPEGYQTTLVVEIAAEGKGKGKGKDKDGKGKDGKGGGKDKGYSSYDNGGGGKSWDSNSSWSKSGGDGKGWSSSNSWDNSNSGWNSNNSWSGDQSNSGSDQGGKGWNSSGQDQNSKGWDNSSGNDSSQSWGNSQSQSWSNSNDSSQGGKGWDNNHNNNSQQSWGNQGGSDWGAAQGGGSGDGRSAPYSHNAP